MKGCSLLDEVCHGLVEHVAFQSVSVFDHFAVALQFQLDGDRR